MIPSAGEAEGHRPPRLYLSWLLKDEEFTKGEGQKERPDTTKPGHLFGNLKT